MPALPAAVRTLVHDILDLLYPQDCSACGGELAAGEELICSHCRIKLPYTNFHLQPEDNALHQVFWGRVPIQLAVAYLAFQEKGRVQRLLHQLKYRNNEEVGVLIGRWYGAQLQQVPAFTDIEVVVPVPLHQSKLRQRGYNQVIGFANELAKALQIPVAEKALSKNKTTLTQTKKNRQERWEAMQHLYSIQDSSLIEGKHVLLVDDVITTGATLEACAQLLLKNGAKAVSIAAISYTL